MTGPISYGNDRHISGGGTSTDFDFHAGKVAIRLIPENAVGNDISKCVNIRDTGNGALYPIATATPPQEFDLPLAEGYTQNNGCKYSKDQFNVVRVTFNLSKSAGTIAGGEVVATLPAGFRPKRYWGCVAIGNNIPSDAATRHPVVVQVATNGEISASMMVETDQAELRAIVCAMEFLAAD